MSQTLTARCPNCRQPSVLDTSNPFRPFCSERCKLLDLGQWLSGGYSVPAVEAEDDSDLMPPDQDSRLQ